MQSNKIPKLIQLWVTPRLPSEHIFISPEKRPQDFVNFIKVYFRKWAIHPIKRRIAKYYLLYLQKYFGLIVIAITGSAGKTTTKEMLASILKPKGNTVYSYANIDPVYNIPSTILRCTPRTKYLILEMGIEFPGEMDFYLWLAKPKIGVITNIYKTHTLFLGSEKNIVKEKGKLIMFLGEGDVAILNSEKSYLREVGDKCKARVVWFGAKGIIKAESIITSKQLNTLFNLNLNKNKLVIHLLTLGRQFIYDALAAASVAYALDIIPELIKRGLEDFQKPEHRMNLIKLKSGALVMDDSYNNNPQAAKEAIETFISIAKNKKKVIVFGDMLELGKYEKEAHRQIGKILSKIGLDYLIAVGPASKTLIEQIGKGVWVKKFNEVKPLLEPKLQRDTVVLIKGSRSVGLDRVVSDII